MLNRERELRINVTPKPSPYFYQGGKRGLRFTGGGVVRTGDSAEADFFRVGGMSKEPLCERRGPGVKGVGVRARAGGGGVGNTPRSTKACSAKADCMKRGKNVGGGGTTCG